jgi:hypothetical protein
VVAISSTDKKTAIQAPTACDDQAVVLVCISAEINLWQTSPLITTTASEAGDNNGEMCSRNLPSRQRHHWHVYCQHSCNTTSSRDVNDNNPI